jgi:hypothetical protein
MLILISESNPRWNTFLPKCRSQSSKESVGKKPAKVRQLAAHFSELNRFFASSNCQVKTYSTVAVQRVVTFKWLSNARVSGPDQSNRIDNHGKIRNTIAVSRVSR